MVAYLEHTKQLSSRFVTFTIEQIPRELNSQADALASLGSNFNPTTLNTILIIHLLHPALQNPDEQLKPQKINTTQNPTTKSLTKPYYS